jgi:predicted small lipoprotein YifL
MNNFVSVFFAAALALALTACGDSSKQAADA